MNYGLRKSLEDIAFELKGIKNILASMWHSRYRNEETDLVCPEVYADEYISTEECARRLGISDQTIRNWIITGKKNPKTGWKYGIHYVNIEGTDIRRQTIRIPWNNLIKNFVKNPTVTMHSFYPVAGTLMYDTSIRDKKDSYIPNKNVPKTPDFDEED